MTGSTTGYEQKTVKSPSSKQCGLAQPELMKKDTTNKGERDKKNQEMQEFSRNKYGMDNAMRLYEWDQ